MTMWVNTPAGSNGAAGIQERVQDRIVHFDATRRRKEKMRQRASAEENGSPAEPPDTVASNGRASAAGREEANGATQANGELRGLTPPARPAVATDAKQLDAVLIEFVVEQTGYPPEMVELDADLEADLGIDSIKKAQLFGELAERFSIQATPGDLSLDDFPTLRHVRDFLAGLPANGGALRADRNGHATGEEPGLPPAPVPATQSTGGLTPPARAGISVDAGELDSLLIEFVVEQTGYPPEMVELDADLEADLGIDSIKKAQLFGELAERFSIQATPGDLSLDDFPTLRHVRDYLSGLLGAPGDEHAGAQSHQSNGSAHRVAGAKALHAPAVTDAGGPGHEDRAPATHASTSGELRGRTPPARHEAAMGEAELEQFLIDFVVEHTGYPPEMVELDADLEADLGIDSIKKAQLFGELAEHFDVRVATGDLSLDDFPTLRHVLGFLKGVPAKATTG